MTNPIGIINGTSDLSPIGLTMATISALTHAGLALILRKLGKTEHPTTTALIHNCITFLLFRNNHIWIKYNWSKRCFWDRNIVRTK